MRKGDRDMPELFMHYLRHGVCMAAVAVVVYGGAKLVGFGGAYMMTLVF